MLYRLLFQVLECPSVRCKRPGFFKWPSPMMVFIFILVSYFLITGGVIYDMIVGPPSMGSETDARGNQRPVCPLSNFCNHNTC
ncbi:oligosaccharyltransferase complex subunit OSTC [Clonorchis sinensis]|uniref:Oligosaccharyltransferase complex subunit n=1 Tax=Clonorchis sinensis TaxID=79923 RepID=G7Y4I5_CLOSI|nr:oligosaccharyltransferase complex subunit OSTC [Clonorchis sinensis]